MRDEIVETMARAIYDHAASSPKGQPDWDEAGDDMQEWVKDHTRDAIRALESAGYRIVGREHTKEMAVAILYGCLHSDVPTAATIWQAAFDAAPLYGEVGE